MRWMVAAKTQDTSAHSNERACVLCSNLSKRQQRTLSARHEGTKRFKRTEKKTFKDAAAPGLTAGQPRACQLLGALETNNFAFILHNHTLLRIFVSFCCSWSSSSSSSSSFRAAGFAARPRCSEPARGRRAAPTAPSHPLLQSARPATLVSLARARRRRQCHTHTHMRQWNCCSKAWLLDKSTEKKKFDYCLGLAGSCNSRRRRFATEVASSPGLSLAATLITQ